MNRFERWGKHGPTWPWVLAGVVVMALVYLLIMATSPSHPSNNTARAWLFTLTFGAMLGLFVRSVVWFGASMERWMCVHCGTRVRRNSLFCRACGSRLPAP